MAEVDILAAATQFGVAGLMGWMWLSERRSAAAREQALSEAHERLMQERRQLDVLVKALDDNTRALVGIEAGQARLAELLGKFSEVYATVRRSAVRRRRRGGVGGGGVGAKGAAMGSG